MRLGELALQRLLKFDFITVLDIGSGEGWHADELRKAGKDVLEIGLVPSERPNYIQIAYEDFNLRRELQFDCIWCCHVLEHQPNVNQFLQKFHNDSKPGALIAITVPPLKHEIVGGHVSLWNAGLLLYNLVLAGFDCREALVRHSEYNITVILRRWPIDLPELRYDAGDIDRLAPFLPAGLKEGFNGQIEELNWGKEI
jgi:SAM-dependent methyltransferase